MYSNDCKPSLNYPVLFIDICKMAINLALYIVVLDKDTEELLRNMSLMSTYHADDKSNAKVGLNNRYGNNLHDCLSLWLTIRWTHGSYYEYANPVDQLVSSATC